MNCHRDRRRRLIAVGNLLSRPYSDFAFEGETLMAILSLSAALVLALAAGSASAADNGPDVWDSEAGKVAPELVAAGWIGTPVSLSAVKGNTVVLAFWNLDVAWC
jgi:hypothetical protein